MIEILVREDSICFQNPDYESVDKNKMYGGRVPRVGWNKHHSALFAVPEGFGLVADNISRDSTINLTLEDLHQLLLNLKQEGKL